jgi:TMEM175 potassium channel family protein
MSKSRLEAFSDGVIAVAITLLVLDIHVPDPASTARLGHALAQQWPNYLAYITSFLTIGIIWVNHHRMIERLRVPDQTVLVLNLLLLLSICVLPFATSLVASYLRESQGEHLAAAIYSGALLVMGLLFVTLQRHILIRRPLLLGVTLNEDQRRTVLRRNASGIVPYVLALAIAPLSSYASLLLCTAVAVFYALPFATASELGA